MGDAPGRNARRGHLSGALVLLLVVVWGAASRIDTALSSARFDTERAEGLLVSDPALMYYLTRRVVEERGIPADFHADPRIEHPGTVDVPARFTVGQEFLVALVAWIVGDRVPLHVLCAWVMGIVASLTAVGVWGFALEFTRSVRWACLAAIVFAILPANYRTIGFVLVREDLCLPIFAGHLWLAARAVRRRTGFDCLLAGLSLGLALATWHAAAFVATLEVGAMFLWFLWTGRNPFARASSAQAIAGMALPCLLVPALWAKGAILSPAMQLAGGMLVAGIVARTRPRYGAWIALAGVGTLFMLAQLLLLALGSHEDLRHVVSVLWLKASHLGVLPTDPELLGFEARMMWQGPFATLTPAIAWSRFQVALVLLPLVIVLGHLRALRREGGDMEHVLLVFLVLSCGTAWLVMRLTVLVGILLPVVFAAAGQRALGRSRSAIPRLGVAALVFFQVVAFGSWLGRHDLSWYAAIPRRHLAAALSAVEEHVPPGEAVAADFMTSPSILAHTGRPIVLQPKWEAAASRERVRQFWFALFHGTPEDLRELLLEGYDCRYLLLDRATLWWKGASRYLAGLGRTETDPRPGTAMDALLVEGLEPGSPVAPGFELLWVGDSLGDRGDVYRLFRLER